MDTDKAKRIIEQVFSLIGTPVDSIEYSLNEKRGHIFSIKSVEFSNISNEREDLTRDLVYLLKRLFNKDISTNEDSLKCTIDINDLQSKIDDKIKIKALNAAEEAKNLKTDVLMSPMSSYERMVVHSILADQIDITTESVGIGKERQVKVKYLAI